MAIVKRYKTKYPGVYYRFQNRLDGYGNEKSYYIIYRRGGRGSKVIEEPIGRETEGMTASKANIIRSSRASGTEMSNTERRQQEELNRKNSKGRWTLLRLWDSYQEANPHHKGRTTDISRFNMYLKPTFSEKTVDEIVTADIIILF